MAAIGGNVNALHQAALLPGIFDGCRETQGSVETIKARRSTCSKQEWLAVDIVGAVNFITAVVSIDEHDMWVYAMDGSYIEPQKVQAIAVTNGDRYSVLVRTHTAGEFKIRASANSAPQMITGHAVLSVEGKGGPERREPKPYIDIVGVPTSHDVVLFEQSIARPYPPEPIAQTADALFVLNMKIAGASYLWALNSTRLSPLELHGRSPPVLFRQPNAGLRNNVTITTLNNTWIDLVFLAAQAPMPPHPIHKHGGKMFQIGSGTGEFRWTSVDDAMREVPERFNLVDPPRRDAFASLPAGREASWVVVRYHVANPGAWLLHCHVSNHLMGGMEMVIQDGVDAWPKVPEEYLEYGQ